MTFLKKILVTGADGFIGSHLVEKLLEKNYEVKALCQYNSQSSWGWLENININNNKNLEVILGDIRDFNFMKNSISDCDTIFHLAALIAIPYSYVAPRSYVETNIIGTLNILEAAREKNISKIVHTSTSETYGSAQFVPIHELHPLVAQSPYSATKIGADQLAISFFKSFETPVTILRPFNTYGPRQSARAVIPTIISQIANNNKELKLGSLSPTRDFNFVADTCEAFIEVAKSSKTNGEIINACSNFEISIGETASLIAELMNADIKIIEDNQRIRPESSEVNRLFGDNEKIKRLTCWEPRFGGIEGFKEGLRITIDWFKDKKNLDNYKSQIYNV
jgi:NAD dependent epimerase/dehydratase